MNNNQQLSDLDLELRLRRTLQAVASTVHDVPDATPATRRRRRGRRTLIGLGAIAIAAPVTAGAITHFGPEYVDRLPPDDVIVTGDIEGKRYWMVEAFHRNACGKVEPGVEVVVEEHNIIGREWNTSGYSYGDPVSDAPGGGETATCGYATGEALADPARSFSSGINVGDAFIWVYAVHPDVTALRVTRQGVTRHEPVHPVDGAGFALVELPDGTPSFTVELVIDGDVVPGSRRTRQVPEP